METYSKGEKIDLPKVWLKLYNEDKNNEYLRLFKS